MRFFCCMPKLWIIIRAGFQKRKAYGLSSVVCSLGKRINASSNQYIYRFFFNPFFISWMRSPFLGLRILLSFARAHNIIMCSVLCQSTFLLKNMFYNILVNQAVTKLFQKTCEKTVDIFGLNCNMRYFCTRFPRDGKPCNWHSDRNGVRTLTFFFPFALIPTKNTVVEKKKEKNFWKHLEDMC